MFGAMAFVRWGFGVAAAMAGPAGAAGGPFGDYVGEYVVELRTSDRRFEDRLRIGSVQSRRDAAIADFTGEFEVPGVFVAALEDGVLRDRAGDSGEEVAMEFRITADEGATPYPVYFRALGRRADPCVLNGEATLDEAGRDRLGTFRARKLDAACPDPEPDAGDAP